MWAGRGGGGWEGGGEEEREKGVSDVCFLREDRVVARQLSCC